MAEKSAKKKPKKADQPSVLGSLPSTRPSRMGRARPRSGATATATKTRAAKSSPRATKAQARAKRGSATPRPRAGTKPKAAGTKPRTAPPREPATTSPPPRSDGRRSEPPRGLELVTTGAQAAGELARIGLTVGGQVLKRAARRLPRP